MLVVIAADTQWATVLALACNDFEITEYQTRTNGFGTARVNSGVQGRIDKHLDFRSQGPVFVLSREREGITRIELGAIDRVISASLKNLQAAEKNLAAQAAGATGT